MSFGDWLRPVATATPATPATDDRAGARTVATVATVAVATPPDTKSEAEREAFEERAAILEFDARIETSGGRAPGGPVDRSGQQPDAIRQWQRQWQPVWEQERGSLPACAPSRYEAERRICELVAAWNRSTGQQRIPAEVLEHLERADYGDRELMTPGGLALYVATVLGDQV